MFQNRLTLETSPYLLQHAHNPVDWYPWGDEAWNKAKGENKLVIVSIGYSACHWCHVMERECFEDEEVASLMNKSYICIKVDREERPDVDQFFMDAANIMSGRGGWPLNCFALPDGRPVYAGTYFPKTSWTGLLHEIANGYKFRTKHYVDYADKLIAGIKALNPVKFPEVLIEFPKETAGKIYLSIARIFDHTNGGTGRAPKFPMPDIYNFLLSYFYHSGDKGALDHVLLTLDKMALGGIYDQIGGGFARYSTDAIWKSPHFEKMLYDNAQLIGLYSDAFCLKSNPLYKKVVYQSIAWIEREMLSPQGGFYSALDADSEGEEGKFYVWTEAEIDEILAENAGIAKAYFGIGNVGYWEKDNNILVIAKSSNEIAKEYNFTLEETEEKIEEISNKLLEARSKRIRPGLDNKILTSWNALMIKGLLKAYNAFGDGKFLTLATNNLHFLQSSLLREGRIYHTIKNGQAVIPGFLEDYAFFIEALIEYYQVSFEEKYINEANRLCQIVIDEFYDETSGYFFFTSEANNEVVSRKIDVSDNVISSPNSVMAHNLFLLSKIFDNEYYAEMSKRMLSGAIENMIEHGAYYSNWGRLWMNLSYPFYEVAVCGENALEKRKFIAKKFIPNKVLFGASNSSDLPLFAEKVGGKDALIYICIEKTCSLPSSSIEDVIMRIQSFPTLRP